MEGDGASGTGWPDSDGVAPYGYRGGADMAAAWAPDRGQLPIANLLDDVDQSAMYYSVTPVNDRGRLADRSALRVMQWSALQKLEFEVVPGIVIVSKVTSGRWAVTSHGHLHLPSSIRLAAGIGSPGRVLMAAETRGSRLFIFTMDKLDNALGLPRLGREGEDHERPCR